MPLKMTRTAVNDQARIPILDGIEKNLFFAAIAQGIRAKRIGNSFFFIMPTDEGDRLVEVSAKVRDLKVKPNKDADAVTFETAAAMLDYLIAQEDARVRKAETRAAEKETLKAQNIAKKEKMAAKEAAKASADE